MKLELLFDQVASFFELSTLHWFYPLSQICGCAPFISPMWCTGSFFLFLVFCEANHLFLDVTFSFSLLLWHS